MSHEKKPILRAPRASSAMLPLAILLALVCGALLLALSGYSPIEAYAALLRGSFGNLNAIAEVLVKTTPLLLAALGLTISNRAQVISIGAEGQIYLGAMGAAGLHRHSALHGGGHPHRRPVGRHRRLAEGADERQRGHCDPDDELHRH